MTKDQIKKLAAEIAADLFTCGTGERANRLRLTNEAGYIGGWSEQAVVARIAKKLREAVVQNAPLSAGRER